MKSNWQLPIANCQFRKSGQATPESCLVIALLSLVLFGILQVARLAVARETLDYAAAAGARARTVGFNDFMIHKVVRVANIPNAGAMETPALERNTGGAGRPAARRGLDPRPARHPGGRSMSSNAPRIPLYLAAEHGGQLPAILDYEDWDELRYSVSQPADPSIRVDTRQDVPLYLPPRLLRRG